MPCSTALRRSSGGGRTGAGAGPRLYLPTLPVLRSDGLSLRVPSEDPDLLFPGRNRLPPLLPQVPFCVTSRQPASLIWARCRPVFVYPVRRSVPLTVDRSNAGNGYPSHISIWSQTRVRSHAIFTQRLSTLTLAGSKPGPRRFTGSTSTVNSACTVAARTSIGSASHCSRVTPAIRASSRWRVVAWS